MSASFTSNAMNGMLGRLSAATNPTTSSGISRIESLTRSLHEKAAGAAAAINTAARWIQILVQKIDNKSQITDIGQVKRLLGMWIFSLGLHTPMYRVGLVF